MSDGVAIPLHLAVHVLGVAVAAGLAGLGWNRREELGPTWPGFVVGGLLIVLAHLLSGLVAVETATLPLVIRAAGYAGLAVGALGGFSTSTAVVLAAPLGVHLAAAVAGVMAAGAAARGRLRAAGPVLLLGLGIGGWAVADALGGVAPTLSALVSVAASVAVGTWTIGRLGSSLLARVLAGATALVVLTVLVLSGAGGLVFARDLEQDQLVALDALVDAQARALSIDDAQDLRSLASALAGSALARQVADPSPDAIDARAEALAGLPGVDVALVIGESGTALGSWDVQQQVVGPLAPVDEIALTGNVLVQQALTGVAASGTISTPDRRVLAIGVVPIAPIDDEGNRRLDRIGGALVLGRSVSAQSALAEAAERTAADAVLLVSGRIAGSSDPTLVGPEINEDLIRILAGSTLPAVGVVGDRTSFVAAAPVGTAGQLLLLRDRVTGGDLEAEATRTLFAAGILGLALAAALAAAAARRIVQPVQRLTEAAEAVAAGDVAHDLPPAGADEVGRLATAFGAMVGAVADREADLAEAADVEGDLRRRLETITGSLSEALLAVDEHGTVTRANPAAATILGIDDLVGRPITQVLTGHDETGRTVLAALAGADGRVVNATVGRGNVEVAATSAPLLDSRGRALGRVHLLRDVTGEAQAERMKTEFLANISHELRTPLTPVRGYADVLARRELPHEQVAQLADRIGTSARRLERVIGMLVDYAALEAGRFDVTLVPTSVRSSVDGAVSELLELEARDRVQVRVDRGLPDADVDPVLFRRQLVELLDNALKFSDGRVVVTGRRGPRRTVEVEVRDEGPGMPEELIDTVVDGFRQGDGSATRRHGGLGLGLAMVQRIAVSLGGEVRFTNLDDGGVSAVVSVRAAAS